MYALLSIILRVFMKCMGINVNSFIISLNVLTIFLIAALQYAWNMLKIKHFVTT